jgi:hypothetical protein
MPVWILLELGEKEKVNLKIPKELYVVLKYAFFFMLPACSTIIKQAIKLFSVIFVFPVAILQFLKISCSSMENISA